MIFDELNDEEKILLLSAFDYKVEENIIIDKLMNEPVKSEITGKPISLQEATIVPGSMKIIDSSPLSVSKYLREVVDA